MTKYFTESGKILIDTILSVVVKYMQEVLKMKKGFYPASCVREDGSRRPTRLFSIWTNMKARCHRPSCKEYIYYGAKGVKVCSDWMAYQVFAQWAYENGYTDELTIDRIDSGKDYCPENCQWVTKSENIARKNKAHRGDLAGGKNPAARKVRCVETGIIYDNMRGASLSLGAHRGAVSYAAKTGKQCGGYHWQYA
jgi:hypothetical protein